MTPERMKVEEISTEVATARASVSFPVELYARLEPIAKQKKVSIGWVVRDAV